MSKESFLTDKGWHNLINERKGDDFQEICYYVLKGLGFSNVKDRGSGSDGGRDMEGEYEYLYANKEKIKERCWIQSKNWGSGIGYRRIQPDIQKAEDEHMDKYILLSVSSTTPDCKDDLKKWNKEHRCKVLDWSGREFLDCLFFNSETCKRYFPEQTIPPTSLSFKQMNQKIVETFSETEAVLEEDIKPIKFEIKEVKKEKDLLACPRCKLEQEGWLVYNLHSMLKSYYRYGDNESWLDRYFQSLKIDFPKELKSLPQQYKESKDDATTHKLITKSWEGKNNEVKEFIKKHNIDDLQFTKCFDCNDIIPIDKLKQIKKKINFLVCPYCKTEVPDIGEYKANFENFFEEESSSRILCCHVCSSILDKRFAVYNNVEKNLRHKIFDHLRIWKEGIVGQPYNLDGKYIKKIQTIAEKLNCRILLRGHSTHYEDCFAIHIFKPQE